MSIDVVTEDALTVEDDTSSLAARARDFALAALAAAYPADDAAEWLDTGESADHPGLGPMVRRLRSAGLDGLRSDYLERFDAGKGRVPLYETEYGRMRGLSKGNDLADVVGFYRAFGFDLEEGGETEMPDHLAVELEFYAILLYKSEALARAADGEGQRIVADARRKFLTSHLGAFVGAVAQRPQLVEDPLYGPLFSWCAALVAEECRRIGAVPAPLDFFATSDDPEASTCGACVIPGMDRGSHA